MEELTQLVQMLKEIAPEIWRIARQQVTVEIITGLLQYVVLTVFFVVAIKPAVHLWNKDDYTCNSDAELVRMFTGLGIGIYAFAWLLVTVFGLFGEIVGRLLNPDWYAIEVLRSLLPE